MAEPVKTPALEWVDCECCAEPIRPEQGWACRECGALSCQPCRQCGDSETCASCSIERSVAPMSGEAGHG